MDSRSLAPEQVRKLAEQIDRHVSYFYRLRRRLDELAFEQSDLLVLMVAKAHEEAWKNVHFSKRPPG